MEETTEILKEFTIQELEEEIEKRYEQKMEAAHLRTINTACEHFEISRKALMSNTRLKEVIEVKRVCCYIFHKHFKLSAKKSGSLINLTNHATVLHHCKKIQKKMDENEYYKIDIKGLIEEIEEQ